MLSVIFSTVCLIWYSVVLVVCAIGYLQLYRARRLLTLTSDCADLTCLPRYRYYRSRPLRAVSESLTSDNIPHVTIIRPVKGIEPLLYECLASTFQQSYPRDKLTVYLCVSSRHDPALSILEQVVDEFAHFDAQVFVEDDDALLNSEAPSNFGPNPKIRNMSRAYREAKGDIVWIVDCNVWVGRGAAGRMVDTLCGLGSGKKHKFVHQLPIVVDVTDDSVSEQPHLNFQAASTSTSAYGTLSRQQISEQGFVSKLRQLGGTRLEELFLSSSHAKFYTAINTVLIAPCIIGKSNMFRRSHLDSLTSNVHDGRPPGIDFFSHNICEDHLIGDLLWKRAVPEEAAGEERLGKHALCFGDLAVQPMAGMSVHEYAARRVRWLRVRKFTVLSATLVEPGTESFLCSLMGAFGATTLPWVHEWLGMPQIWTAFAMFWLASVALWAAVDWSLYLFLQAMGSVEVDENTPDFARGRRRKGFGQWFLAWLGREALAFPIWFWAVCGGVTVVWRGKKFRVSIDARVRAVDDGPADGEGARFQPRTLNGHAKSRLRID